MERPKIGLALGSGGARGFAHVGVLKVLQQENIPIHMIAGSSMGALVAAFYGAGHSIDTMLKIAHSFKRKFFIDVTMPPKLGFISGKRIKDFIRLFTHHKKIEQLYPNIAIVATDIYNGEKVVFKSGSVAEAVRASISIPGIFVPEMIEGKMLVDGGVADRVPVSVVKEMGADIVIAVDVSGLNKNPEITNIYGVILQSLDIMQQELVQNRELLSDIYLRPPIQHYSSYAFEEIDTFVQAGEEVTRKAIKEIKNVIQSWKE